jgi:hypothetical protein
MMRQVVYGSGKPLEEFSDVLGPFFQLHMERLLHLLATMAILKHGSNLKILALGAHITV